MYSSNVVDKIGRYEVQRKIAEGGMGEIFLTYDTVCHRLVALKRIKESKASRRYIRRRFLREALVTCRLSHPSILPIYTLHQEEETLYYTMPFVEGKTLTTLIQEARHRELDVLKGHLEETFSIPHLIRIFLSVCYAVEYAHAQKILHRDLKPENILIGKYGEVLLFDWGVAGILNEPDEDPDPQDPISHELTSAGVHPGTIPYMAPEVAFGNPATIQSEIFSLGVILYLILTLELPFHRGTIEEFKKTARFEKVPIPEEVSPYRDIPRQLSVMIKQCLAFRPEDRYNSVSEMIEDLENYIEGKPEWILTKHLDIHERQHWEFQENVFLAQHMAITRTVEVTEWAFLMISKDPFAGNVQLVMNLSLQEAALGIGFLVGVPEPSQRRELEEGYSLWIGSEKFPGMSLFRNHIEVFSIPDFTLKYGEEYEILIEKVENDLKVYIDAKLEMNYHSYLPIMGSHIGLLYKDARFKMDGLDIYTGSQNVMVKCLSIPDAFLASGDMKKAYTEYLRIAASFKGRSEEREALFRAGITLLEEAKAEKKQNSALELVEQASEAFEKLKRTSGAPLEYLGKAFIYQFLEEKEEEIKCLELALRKYRGHYLLTPLEDHILYRLHETANKDRVSAFRFALLSLRYLPKSFETQSASRLLHHFTKHAETLPFIESIGQDVRYLSLCIQLAFWLAKPLTLVDIAETLPPDTENYPLYIANAFFALAELGRGKLMHEKLLELKQQIGMHTLKDKIPFLEGAFQISNVSCGRGIELLSAFPARESFDFLRLLAFFVETHLNAKTAAQILAFLEPFPAELLKMKAALFTRDIPLLDTLFKTKTQEELNNPRSEYFTLYGIFLALADGEKAAKEHLSPRTDATYPRTPSLLSYYLHGRIHLSKGWILASFPWERLQLYRQLELYYFCLKKPRQSHTFREAIMKEYKALQISS